MTTDDPVLKPRNKRQTWPNSCGAAALLTAAHDLEIGVIPATVTCGDTAQPLQLTRDCERYIYAMTAEKAHPRIAENLWGRNLPSKMVTCARLLGLKAVLVQKNSDALRQLACAHPRERSRLRRTGVTQAAHIEDLDEPVPADSRELKLLVKRLGGAGGLVIDAHWVLVRRYTEVLDPGSAAVDDLPRMKARLGMHGAGLSIFVSR